MPRHQQDKKPTAPSEPAASDAKTITQTIRFEVVKPLGCTWDELGDLLRTLRTPLHRVLNNTITELEVAKRLHEERGEEGELIHRSLSYRLVRDLWKQERDAAADRVKKGKPLRGDAKIAETPPHSAIVSGVAVQAFARWKKWRGEKWKGTSSIPSFRDKSPIYVVGAGVDIEAKDGNIVLSVAMHEGHAPRVKLIVNPYGGSGHALARKALETPEKIGDLRIIEEKNREGKVKWQAMLALTHDVQQASGKGVMAIHRGVKTFLTVAIDPGDKRETYTRIMETGDDILRHKAGYFARRDSLGRQTAQLGAGAHGHGEDRLREHVLKLGDAEDRWVRSKCQEIAARTIKLAKSHGVIKILVEEWTNPADDEDGKKKLSKHVEYLVRSFPLAQLREMIMWAAKRAGISCEEVATDHNGKDCPKCGHRNEAAQTWKFMCANCRLERPSDTIFAWNMLIRTGNKNPVEDSIKINKRNSKRLLAKKEEKAPQ